MVAGIIGALISYMFVMGYYMSIGFRVPEETSIVIEQASFSPQNATAFNVSILNPSYSPSNATVNQVKVITGDTVHSTEILHPSLREIKPGELKNFTCRWNWSNDTGEEVRILAFIAEGSGATFKTTTPIMGITITETRFNAAETTNSFNVTVENQPSSVDYVNISKIIVAADTVQELTPSPGLPHALNPGDSETFKVPLTWTYYRNKTVTVTVHTLQGYTASDAPRTPLPVSLTITEAVFNETATNHFNLTVQNSASSPAYANITRISLTMENDTSLDINETAPSLPHIIPSGTSTTFTCSWNWTYYRDKNVTITVSQREGPSASYVKATPPPVLLTITGAVFNATETNHFNVTVKNSEFSILDANVTAIGVTPEGAQENVIANVTPTLPRVLSPNSSVEFTCLWNWTEYQGVPVTITVYAVGYTASHIEVTPMKEESLNITKQHVWFNTSNSTSKAAFLIVNTGDADAVIEKITVNDEECQWSTVHWERTNDTITADLPWIPGTPSSVNLTGTTYLLATSSGNATLYSGYTMIVYIVNPDTITIDEIGSLVEITIYTSRATYSTQSIVQAVAS